MAIWQHWIILPELSPVSLLVFVLDPEPDKPALQPPLHKYSYNQTEAFPAVLCGPQSVSFSTFWIRFNETVPNTALLKTSQKA